MILLNKFMLFTPRVAYYADSVFRIFSETSCTIKKELIYRGSSLYTLIPYRSNKNNRNKLALYIFDDVRSISCLDYNSFRVAQYDHIWNNPVLKIH